MITTLKDWKKLVENHETSGNYMVKANLERIKKQVDSLLQLDDSILENIEPWAIDHLTTSADDIQEVFNHLDTTESKNGLWSNIRAKRKRLSVDKIGSKDSTFKNKKEFDKVAKEVNKD